MKYVSCSSDGYCECKPNYIPLGHDKCLGSVGEYCNSDDECYSYNTVCLNNICQCSDKFYASNRTHCDRSKYHYLLILLYHKNKKIDINIIYF